MIKISVMYPQHDGARFDFDYYLRSHMPMMERLLGPVCLRWEVDRGVSGGAPGVGAPYVAIAHLYCTSLDAFQAALAPHMAEVRADVANYTDLQASRQISDVLAPP